MKMDVFWVKRVVVHEERVRLIHGGAGYSGIAVIVSVFAMNRVPNPTDISI